MRKKRGMIMNMIIMITMREKRGMKRKGPSVKKSLNRPVPALYYI